MTPSWELDGLVGGERPLLLVVDYAETKREVLVPVLRRLIVDRGRSTVRVILVARALSDWWRELQRADPKLQERLDERMVAVEPLAPIALPARSLESRSWKPRRKRSRVQLPEKDTSSTKEPDASTLGPERTPLRKCAVPAYRRPCGGSRRPGQSRRGTAALRAQPRGTALARRLGEREPDQRSGCRRGSPSPCAGHARVSGADDKPAARSLLQRAPMIAGFAPA